MGIRKIIQGECVEYKRKEEIRQNPEKQQAFRKLQKENRKKKKVSSREKTYSCMWSTWNQRGEGVQDGRHDNLWRMRMSAPV